MAVDTQNKRRSVQAYTMGLMRPVPDGVIGLGDRATIVWLYSALGYGPVAPASRTVRLGFPMSPAGGTMSP